MPSSEPALNTFLPPMGALYAGDIHAIDPVTKQPVELLLYRDQATGAMFAVDASYIETEGQVHSPFDGQALVVSDEPHPEGFQTIGHPRQQEVLEELGSVLRTIRDGSDHDGRWLDSSGTECDEDDPEAQWYPFDEEEQGAWLDTVAQQAAAGLQALGVLTGRDEERKEEVDQEAEAAPAPVREAG